MCSSSPCQNGGSCVPFSADTYRCHCRDRFDGNNCEIDSNPCASDPCLNDGTDMFSMGNIAVKQFNELTFYTVKWLL